MTELMGRPTIYTPQLATDICRRIALGESVRKIVKDEDMPSSTTIYNWLLDKDKADFLKQYETAINIKAELMFDELNEIADDGTNDFMERTNGDGETYEVVNTENIQRSRLRVDTRKWYLSKIMPKKFGEKLDLTSKGDKLPASVITGMRIVNMKEEKTDEPIVGDIL